MKPSKILALALSVPLLLSGCGTMATATGKKKEFGIYSGTKRSVENGSHTILDTPLSLVADTLLLPITVPRALLSKSSEPETPKSGAPSAGAAPSK